MSTHNIYQINQFNQPDPATKQDCNYTDNIDAIDKLQSQARAILDLIASCEGHGINNRTIYESIGVVSDLVDTAQNLVGGL